jgi:hypothetical protein
MTQVIGVTQLQGEDFAVKSFDEQIASGTKVLEHMLVNQSFDLSRGPRFDPLCAHQLKLA